VARPADVPYVKRRRPSRSEIALATVGVAALGGIAALLLLRSGPTSRFDGFVYVESNDAESGRNAVLAYAFRKNRFHFLGGYPTGGTGSIDLGGNGALDAQGQIAVDRRQGLLFAVNQGSDTVAVFHIARSGRLIAVHGSPFPAGGKAPASVGLAGRFAVVVDKAHDANGLPLQDVKPAYRSFRLGTDGSLKPLPAPFRAPVGSSPTEALTIGRRLVVGTEETGPFRAFALGADGRLREAPGSPLGPGAWASIFPPGDTGARWVIGLVVHPTRRILYGNQARTSKLLAFNYDLTGRLSFVRAVSNNGAKLPCWTVVTPDGRYLYTANADNGTVSAFRLAGDPTSPRHLQTVALEHAGNPWGLALDNVGKTLFVVDPRALEQVPQGRGNRLHALAVGSGGRLRELDSSPVRLPVGTDASPLGIAVVPRG
jgi:Lactonase, 7-bladed beta-propeller